MGQNRKHKRQIIRYKTLSGDKPIGENTKTGISY